MITLVLSKSKKNLAAIHRIRPALILSIHPPSNLIRNRLGPSKILEYLSSRRLSQSPIKQLHLNFGTKLSILPFLSHGNNFLVFRAAQYRTYGNNAKKPSLDGYGCIVVILTCFANPPRMPS